jgi:hypothetical protein
VHFTGLNIAHFQVSYIKGVDLFMMGCVAYIFLSIVELAMVGILEKVDNNSHCLHYFSKIINFAGSQRCHGPNERG